MSLLVVHTAYVAHVVLLSFLYGTYYLAVYGNMAFKYNKHSTLLLVMLPAKNKQSDAKASTFDLTSVRKKNG